jgi:hypothetical protein
MSEPDPHPILALIEGATRTANDKPRLDPKIEAPLAALLEAHGADPQIANVVLACFDLAARFFEADAPGSAALILRALKEAQPHLLGIDSKISLRDKVETARRRPGEAPARAPLIDARPPKGAIKAATMMGPPRRIGG